MSKGSICQERFTSLNIFALKIGLTKYVKQLLRDIKEDTDSNMIITEDFNTLLSHF